MAGKTRNELIRQTQREISVIIREEKDGCLDCLGLGAYCRKHLELIWDFACHPQETLARMRAEIDKRNLQ